MDNARVGLCTRGPLHLLHDNRLGYGRVPLTSPDRQEPGGEAMKGLAMRHGWWSSWLAYWGIKNDILRLSPYEVDRNHIVEIRPWKLNLTNTQLRKEEQEQCRQT